MTEASRDLHVMPFSPDEYARRLDAVRRGMAEREVDLLLVTGPENVTYLTGYETIGYASFQCLAVPADGPLTMIVREMEKTVAATSTRIDDIAGFGDTEDAVETVRTVLGSRGRLGGRIGLEDGGWFVSPAAHGRLRAGLGGDRVTSGSGIVEVVRRIKSSREIDLIRTACRLTEAGMRAALEAIRPGATENHVAAAAYNAMTLAGSDFYVGDPIVTSGWRSGVAHFTFANRTLESGDTLLIELGAAKRRYFGPLMRGASIGRPCDEIRRMADVILAALNAAIAAIRPGVTSGAVDAACRGVIEEAGFEPYFRKRTGYSVGVAFAPDWGEGHILSLRRDDPTVLKAGMVFHIPPALRLPRRWGLGFSETVLVSDSGCEVLTRHPRALFVAGGGPA
ncbi:MAG: aminopeptidase P family protein [Armatimonadetes bacterium]|nr:aminopeptidase P family protein [Armatimonadota bacterium]